MNNTKVDPILLLTKLHVEKPIVKYVSTYGYNPSIRYQWVYGSVSKYFNDPLNLIEEIVPINQNIYQGTIANQDSIIKAEDMKLVRSGIIHEENKYIIYHDTGNHTPNANARAHANYLVSEANKSYRARSWHYTVDEKSVIQHIPDNEVSWQGDSYDAYAKGIGVETCVDFGSDIHATWQRNAKLMARLLDKYNLGFESIKQHFDFNGKNCPQTLRMNNLYDYAIDIVKAEYEVLTKLRNYQISFESLNKEIVDDRGRVIKLPESETKVGYVVNISGDNYHESKVLYSIIPGLDTIF